eukprot:jgi/Ulvmu1/2276/UM013_0123.1
MDPVAEDSVELAEKPKPKFKFLKKGEGTHKRVFAPKLKQQQKFQESFSAKVDLADVSGEHDSHQSENSQLENHDNARVNKSRPTARQSGLKRNSPFGPGEVSGSSWLRCDSGNRDTGKDESTEWSTDVASAFHADAEVQEFARLERQIRMEVGDCTPSPQAAPRPEGRDGLGANGDARVKPRAVRFADSCATNQANPRNQKVSPEPSFSSLYSGQAVAASTSELTFQPHKGSPPPDGAAHGTSTMWDHDFSATNSYAAAHASKPAAPWHHGSHSSMPPQEQPLQPHTASMPPGMQAHHQALPPQSQSHSTGLGPGTAATQAQPFTGERLWSMQTPAAVAANAAVAAAAEAAAAYAPAAGAMHGWHGQATSPPSVGGVHGHRGSPLVEAKEKELQDETDKMRLEREHVSAIRANLTQAQQALDQERLAFEAHKANVKAAMDAEASRTQEKLRKERSALERQKSALTKLPTRKERAEVEAAEAVVEGLRKDSKAKDARHKLTVERMRRQIVTLQESNQQLTTNLNETGKELEAVRAEVAKKAKKKAKNQRSAGTQCELSYLDDAAPQHGHIHHAHTFVPDHSRIPSADSRTFGGHTAPPATADHGWPGVQANHHSGKVVPAVTRHNVPQASAGEPGVPNVAVGIPFYPPVGVPGAAAAAQMHSLADTAPPPNTCAPMGGAQQQHSHAYHPYHGLGASWPGPGPSGSAPAQGGTHDTAAAHPQSIRNDPPGPQAHHRSSSPAEQMAGPGSPEIQTAGAPEDVALWHAKRGLTPVRTSPPGPGEGAPERLQVSEQGGAVGGGAHGSQRGQGNHPAAASGSRPTSTRNGAGTPPMSMRHVSWSGVPSRRGADELDSMHGRHAPALSWAGDSGPGRDRQLGRAEADMGDTSMAQYHLYRTNESDASGRGGPMEGHSGKSSGRGVPPGLSGMNSVGTVSVDENDGTGFNAGKLAEVAAIQAELGASRHQRSESSLRHNAKPSPGVCMTTGLNGSGRTSTSPTGGARRSSTSPLLPSSGLSGSMYPTASLSGQGFFVPPSAPSSRPSPPLVDADGCTRTVDHPDGRVEKWYVDGRRTVRFSNGTAKHALRDGTAVVTFGNGDVKRTTPDGRVHYYYKEVDTWHTTLPSSSEVFYFPNGQTEAHHKDGSKEILFPDGMLRKVLSSGEEVAHSAASLSEAVLTPKPQPVVF